MDCEQRQAEDVSPTEALPPARSAATTDGRPGIPSRFGRGVLPRQDVQRAVTHTHTLSVHTLSLGGAWVSVVSHELLLPI